MASSGQSREQPARCRRYQSPALRTAHHQLWQRRHGLASLQSLAPVCENVQQRSDFQPRMFCWILRQIAHRARQQRLAPDQVSAGMMMKRDRNLDQPLKEFALRLRRRPPDIFENLVGLEELG